MHGVPVPRNHQTKLKAMTLFEYFNLKKGVFLILTWVKQRINYLKGVHLLSLIYYNMFFLFKAQV